MADIKHTEGRFLRHVKAGYVATDLNGAIWLDDAAGPTRRIGAKSQTLAARSKGWTAPDVRGVERLTDAGVQALVQHLAAVAANRAGVARWCEVPEHLLDGEGS